MLIGLTSDIGREVADVRPRVLRSAAEARAGAGRRPGVRGRRRAARRARRPEPDGPLPHRPRPRGRAGRSSPARTRTGRRATSAAGTVSGPSRRPTSSSRPPSTSRSSSRTRTGRLSGSPTSPASPIPSRTCGRPASRTASRRSSSSSSASRARTSSRPSTASTPSCRSCRAEVPPTVTVSVMLDRTETIRVVREGRRDHASDLDLPRHPRRLRVSAERPLDAHPERRRARFADRDVRRHVSARLQHRQPVAHGPDDRDRLRRGRCHRRHREHHAAPRGGHEAVRGRARGAHARSGSRSSRSACRSSPCSSRSC